MRATALIVPRCDERVCKIGMTSSIVEWKRLCAQVLLAVAQGAFILSPEWVTASLEVGRWLPEDRFISKVSPIPVASHTGAPRSGLQCARKHSQTATSAQSRYAPHPDRACVHVCSFGSRRRPSECGGNGCCPARYRRWSEGASTCSRAPTATLPCSRACGGWWQPSERRRARSALPRLAVERQQHLWLARRHGLGAAAGDSVIRSALPRLAVERQQHLWLARRHGLGAAAGDSVMVHKRLQSRGWVAADHELQLRRSAPWRRAPSASCWTAHSGRRRRRVPRQLSGSSACYKRPRPGPTNPSRPPCVLAVCLRRGDGKKL